jgi:hypothetical protein
MTVTASALGTAVVELAGRVNVQPVTLALSLNDEKR